MSRRTYTSSVQAVQLHCRRHQRSLALNFRNQRVLGSIHIQLRKGLLYLCKELWDTLYMYIPLFTKLTIKISSDHASKMHWSLDILRVCLVKRGLAVAPIKFSLTRLLEVLFTKQSCQLQQNAWSWEGCMMLIVLTFRLQYSTHGFLPGNVKVEWSLLFLVQWGLMLTPS